MGSIAAVSPAGAGHQGRPHLRDAAVDSGPRLQQDGPPIETVDALVRDRAQKYPHSTILSYPSEGIQYVDYTMQQLDVFAFRVARALEARLPVRGSSAEKPRTVALLGPSNFEYLITMLALMKLGHTILFLSTRISPEAIASLMRTTGAHSIVADARYSKVAGLVKESMAEIDLLSLPLESSFNFPIEAYTDTRLDQALDLSIEASNIVYIIHSSGSTGFPKPIYQTQKAAISNYASSMNMKALITLPLYHNHGICNFFRAVYAGKSIHMYNADLPLTSGYLTTILQQHPFEIFYGVPYALKLLAETKTGIDLLRELKIVMYGGSALPDEVGNSLVEQGVNLISHYGATEVGQLMTSFRPVGDTAWNYVREHAKLTPYLKWIPRGTNLFECCVAEGWPAKLTSNQPDGSYATKDLFEPHPTVPGAWKYIARQDDTIALVNGEKFSPVAMEGRIRSDKSVKEVVVFGVGRPSLGLLIVPSESTKSLSEAEILALLKPIVDEANAAAESYARISLNMIKLLPHDSQYPRTDKGSIIRQAFYKTYAKEIDDTYDATNSGSILSRDMDLSETKQFLRQLIPNVIAHEDDISDSQNLFSLGIDSLQAIQIRSEILRNVNVGGKKLGQNIVFDHPTIEKLSLHLYNLCTGDGSQQDISVEEEMERLVAKYTPSADFGKSVHSSVVVTGTTGSLGAHVIARLAVYPSVKRIYCLVRAKDSRQALIRVRQSLVQRKVYHTLPLEARKKLLCLPFNQSDETLGLEPGVYKDITRDLRAVIHCAWSVNFNLHVSSFEDDCIAGVRNLLQLCQDSKGAFNFCSSVSTVSRCPLESVPEAEAEYSWAQGMGYAQSKSIAERICLRSAEALGIKARILRVGQIIADTQHGVWNATEAIPMMLQSALTIGALPRLGETPSWLPVDTVAQAVLDISLSGAGSVVANVVNSRTFDWTSDLLPALRAAGLQFEELEPKEWVCRLRASNSDAVANPPFKLVEFFASKYDRDEFAPSKPFDTITARALSPALAQAPVLDQNFVNRFVGYFMSSSWKAPVKSGSVVYKQEPTIIFIGGPCGSGKTTLGREVATWLEGAFIEGDSLHTQRAVQQMAAKLPLSDEDRWGWLDRIATHAREAVYSLGYDVAVISCSALKNAYRQRLRRLKTGNAAHKNLRVVFVDLQASRETLVGRVNKRVGHYMTAEMVESQIAQHEDPQPSELDVLPIDAEDDLSVVLEDMKWALSTVLDRACIKN